MTGHIGTGAGGSLGVELETIKGVPASPITHWVPVTGNTIGATFDVIKQNAFYGSRHMEQIVRVLKGKVAGTITHPVFAGAGIPLFLSLLGKEIYLSALAADTIKTGTTVDTSTGLAAITLTNTGGVTYTKGALVTLSSGLTQEPLSICEIIGNGAPGTIVHTKIPKSTTPLVPGTAFRQIDQHWFQPKGPLDSFSWENPTVTLERNYGRQFAWLCAGTRILKTDLKWGKDLVEATHTVAVTTEPTRLDNPANVTAGHSAFTTFAPSTDERSQLWRPFSIRDGWFVVPNDQTADGTGELSRLVEMESGQVTWDNHGIDKDYWSDQRIKENFLGMTSGTLQYKYSLAAGYPYGTEKYLFTEGAPPVPFFMRTAINRSTDPLNPLWNAMSVYVPAGIVTNAPFADPANDTINETVDMTIVEDQDGSPPLQIFIANSLTSAYAGL